MPYIPKKTEFEKLARLIKGYGNAPAVAEKMKCSQPTARARLANPEDITLKELKRISQGFHIPIEEIRQAITW